MMIQSEYIFPTPYWWIDIDDLDNQKILSACYELEHNQEGRQFSNYGGYQSNDLSYDYPAFIDLLNCITSASSSIFDQGYHNFYYSPYSKVCIGNYWVNINRKNHCNMLHIHPGAFLSGVYYVSADSQLDQGDFFFLRDFSWITNHGHYFDDLKGKECPAYLEQHVRLSPQTGTLLLFPSYLPHYVGANQSDTDRVSISFNIVLEKS